MLDILYSLSSFSYYLDLSPYCLSWYILSFSRIFSIFCMDYFYYSFFYFIFFSASVALNVAIFSSRI
jgi:hypothetical protein